MSRTSSPPVDDEAPAPDDPLEPVAERRDLFERIANSDLPLSEACQRALDELDENGGADGE